MSDNSISSREEKGEVKVTHQHVDNVAIDSKLAGLRVDGDGEDHEHEPPVRFDDQNQLRASIKTDQA